MWDLRGEKPSFVALEGHQGTVNSASFSPDGTHAVTASADKTARVWDLRGEKPSFVALEEHQGAVFSASFSPDGTHVVTSSDDKTARVWDLRVWVVTGFRKKVTYGLGRVPKLVRGGPVRAHSFVPALPASERNLARRDSALRASSRPMSDIGDMPAA